MKEVFENDLVSIIMPAYNCAKYIEESIASVLNQTYPKWELLIIVIVVIMMNGDCL